MKNKIKMDALYLVIGRPQGFQRNDQIKLFPGIKVGKHKWAQKFKWNPHNEESKWNPHTNWKYQILEYSG